MVFWHNSRYEEVEKASSGDPMRGLPEQKFPWMLGKGVFVDDTNDTWNYEFSCLEIAAEKNNNKVKALINMNSKSIVSRENLVKMNISSERLDALEVVFWNQLEEKYTLNVICDFDKIENQIRPILKKWISFVKKKYTFEVKSKEILEKIRTSKISRFSE